MLAAIEFCGAAAEAIAAADAGAVPPVVFALPAGVPAPGVISGVGLYGTDPAISVNAELIGVIILGLSACPAPAPVYDHVGTSAGEGAGY
jgi:hypothetical protein